MDYFLARYYSSAQGRFSTPDPIFIQKEAIVDPQRNNLYAYVRNNPLKYIDPKGEEIELIGDDENRRKILNTLRSAVGQEAASYLYERKVAGKDGKDHYFVGVHENGPDGKGKAFQTINKLTDTLSDAIRDPRIATITIQPKGTLIAANLESGEQHRIDTLGMGSPGITKFGANGPQINILDPSLDYGKLPRTVMSDGRDNQMDPGDALAHEIGHVLFEWGRRMGPSRDSALALENFAREIRDPNGPMRIRHQPGDPRIGEGKWIIKVP